MNIKVKFKGRKANIPVRTGESARFTKVVKEFSDFTDSILIERKCNDRIDQSLCRNPNCGGWFSHSQVGLHPATKDNLPEGFIEP